MHQQEYEESQISQTIMDYGQMLITIVKELNDITSAPQIQIIIHMLMISMLSQSAPQIQILSKILSNAKPWAQKKHMMKLKLLLYHKTRGFQPNRSWLPWFKWMEVMQFLKKTDGHLSETLME